MCRVCTFECMYRETLFRFTGHPSFGCTLLSQHIRVAGFPGMVSGQPSLGFWVRGLFEQTSFGFGVRQGRLNDVRKQYRLWYQKGVNTV
jgi:hypothetical protein